MRMVSLRVPSVRVVSMRMAPVRVAWPRPGRMDATGSVTAETAVLLPTLVLVTGALAWLVGAGVAQVQCVDAARDAARGLARGESTSTASALARGAAPDGATVQVRRSAGMVEVVVTYRATPPGVLLDHVAALDLRAAAATPAEVSDVAGAVAMPGRGP